MLLGGGSRRSCALGSAADKAEVGCRGDDGGAGVDVELGVDAGQVGLDGAFRQMEACTDGLVGQSVGRVLLRRGRARIGPCGRRRDADSLPP